MYKNFEVLEISRNKILVQKKNRDPISMSFSSDLDFSKYDETLDYESETVSVRLYKRNMIIKTGDDLIKVYIPKPVRYLIIKDVQKKGLFSLTYRKHLYQEYDSEKHVLIKVNHIPENREFLIDSAEEKAKNYSTGIHNMPILICYYDNSKDRLSYNIVKESVVIETGFIDAFACADHLKIAA
jgi:hypothetical protein